jgi:hypothetical protein
MGLLTQNSELRAIGVYNWTLPALGAKLDDGRTVLTCPEAGACAQFCYARNGTYLFRNVKQAHARNLKMVLDGLENWKSAMVAELQAKKFRGGKHVRIHDSGDFFSDEYLMAWMEVARQVPDVVFYAYTKEVKRFKRLVEGKAPENFRWLYSLGGKQDHLIDRVNDRHAEVFPSEAALEEAGYFNQEESDLLAIYAPTNRIGIVANNIPAFKKKMGSRTFGQVQEGTK